MIKKMKITELRINNYVKASNDSIFKPSYKGKTEIVTLDILLDISRKEGLYLPIPLTEKWLLSLGFKKAKHPKLNKNCWEIDCGFSIIIAGKGWWDVYTNYSVGQIINEYNFITDNRGLKHVHQLQNLYFALTEKELKLIE